MNAPVIELPSGFCEGIECRRRPHEDALQPDGKGLNRLGRRTGLSVDLDNVGSVPGTVFLGVARHRALLQLLDPFDLVLKAIADVDSECGVFGVEDVSLRATFEGLVVFLDEVFKPIDSIIESLYLGPMVFFSLLESFEQRLGDALQGIGVEVSAHVKDVGC